MGVTKLMEIERRSEGGDLGYELTSFWDCDGEYWDMLSRELGLCFCKQSSMV